MSSEDICVGIGISEDDGWFFVHIFWNIGLIVTAVLAGDRSCREVPGMVLWQQIGLLQHKMCFYCVFTSNLLVASVASNLLVIFRRLVIC